MARNRCRTPRWMCKTSAATSTCFQATKCWDRWPRASCGAGWRCSTRCRRTTLACNMAHEVDFEHSSFEHGALKFQAGTPDVAGPVGLAAAIDFLAAAGADSTWRHDQELVRHGLNRLAAIKGLRLLGPRTADQRVPVFTFAINGQSPMAVAKALNLRGVAIRAGDMAALP